ncbi:hypothetical protein F5Y10DRAFT_270478 [Nemania abortiva]|nr:hypothetical protein F5Y10DRAFT_270478 [Nemania abortiva]
MPSIPSFTQFGRLPTELRNLVWRFACHSGPMRLTLQELSVHSSRYPTVNAIATFLLPNKWHKHVLKHQRQRMAILHVNSEARSEALRYLELIRRLDFPILMMPREDAGSPIADTGTTRHPRALAMDWDNDLIHLLYYPMLVIKQTALLNRITRLAVKLDPYYHPFPRFDPRSHWDENDWAKNLLEDFSNLEHLTIVHEGHFSEVYWELGGYGYVSCLEEITKNEYYFSPKDSIEEWMRQAYPNGPTERSVLLWRHHLGDLNRDQLCEIITALKPGLEVENVIDTTEFYMVD